MYALRAHISKTLKLGEMVFDVLCYQRLFWGIIVVLFAILDFEFWFWWV